MTEQMKELINLKGVELDDYPVTPMPSKVLRDCIRWYLDNLWHDANEEPEYGKSIVMIRKQEPPFAGKYFGSRIKIDYKTYWDVYNGFVCQEIEPSKWCYLEDIVTLRDEL